MLNKQRIKQLLYGFEIRSTAIIANDLVSGEPKMVTLKKLKAELYRIKDSVRLSDNEVDRAWKSIYSLYVNMRKNSYVGLRKAKDDVENRKDAVQKTIDDLSVLDKLERNKNELANAVENRIKLNNLNDLLAEGIFYLCSSHINPAKDHADWEGKVYVSEDWEGRCSDRAMIKKVRSYIRNHDTQTVEWVIGAPVYMTTRPNCKHYFINLTVEETLTHSVRSLLKKHGMYMKEEAQITYDRARYIAAYERLKALVYLNKLCPSRKLQERIKLTRARVNKLKKRTR